MSENGNDAVPDSPINNASTEVDSAPTDAIEGQVLSAQAVPRSAIKEVDFGSVCFEKEEDQVKMIMNALSDFQPVDFGEIMITIAKGFEDYPYVGDTLKCHPNKEVLKTRLDGLDCWTYVETVLALARVYNLGADGDASDLYQRFRNQVELIRYREGIVDGYPSRLHYTTDWIYTNERKTTSTVKGTWEGVHDATGLVSDVTELVCTSPSRVTSATDNVINLITDTSEECKANDTFMTEMLSREAILTKLEERSLILPDDLNNEKLLTGDIVAFTKQVKGLDFNHMGLIELDNDGEEIKCYVWNAPSEGKLIRREENTISGYMAGAGFTKVAVARAIRPA